MEELWFRTLGFYNNPFSIKPAAFSDEVIGYNLDEVFDKIDSGKIVYVIGGFGTGKTTLMKHIIRRFGGRRQVVHVTISNVPKDPKMGRRPGCDVLVAPGDNPSSVQFDIMAAYAAA